MHSRTCAYGPLLSQQVKHLDGVTRPSQTVQPVVVSEHVVPTPRHMHCRELPDPESALTVLVVYILYGGVRYIRPHVLQNKYYMNEQDRYKVQKTANR